MLFKPEGAPLGVNPEKHTTHKAEAGEAQEEIIKDAAIMYNGDIFTGASHGHALSALLKKFPNFDHYEIFDGNPDLEGFITSSGRFITRKEALEIARKGRQIRKGENNTEYQELHSEDL